MENLAIMAKGKIIDTASLLRFIKAPGDFCHLYGQIRLPIFALVLLFPNRIFFAMKNFLQLCLTSLLLGLPLLAEAHAGHGVHRTDEVGHYLGEPVHIVPLATLVALTVVVLFLFGRQLWKLRKEEVRK